MYRTSLTRYIHTNAAGLKRLLPANPVARPPVAADQQVSSWSKLSGGTKSRSANGRYTRSYKPSVQISVDDKKNILQMVFVIEETPGNPQEVFSADAQFKLKSGAGYILTGDNGASQHANTVKAGDVFMLGADKVVRLTLNDKTWVSTSPRAVVGLYGEQLSTALMDLLAAEAKEDEIVRRRRAFMIALNSPHH